MSNASTSPNVQYSFTINATIDGVTAPLTIAAPSMQDVRAALRLLKEHNLIATQPSPPAQAAQQSGGSCPHHQRPLKPSRKPGSFFCTHRNDDGSYCQYKASA